MCVNRRKRESQKTECGGILAELALSVALLITLVGGAIDITMQVVRYGELIEVAKTATKMAAKLPADGSVSNSLEDAADDAIANVNAYLTDKGLDPADFDIQFLASSRPLESISELKGENRFTTLVTIAIKQKSDFNVLPSKYIFDNCVKSTYIWENAQNVIAEYTHDNTVSLGCI